jgi:ABC-type Fe3+-hydroxamate transport system substrate-binding protein
MRKETNLSLVVIIGFLMTVWLAACGDNTATPVPATTVTTTTNTAVRATTAATTIAANLTTTVITTQNTTSSVVTATVPPSTAVQSVSPASATDFSFTDNTGFKGTLSKQAARIACLTPDCVDILLDLGVQPVGLFRRLL